MVGRIVGLLICALVLYGVAPAVLGVLDAWPRVADIQPYWFVALIVAQVGSWAGFWLVQRLSVDARSWWPIITSQLASGALGPRRAGRRRGGGGAAVPDARAGGDLAVAGRRRDRRGHDRHPRHAVRAAAARAAADHPRGRGAAAARAGGGGGRGDLPVAARDRGDADGQRSGGALGGAGVAARRRPAAEEEAAARRPARGPARPARSRPQRVRRALVGGRGRRRYALAARLGHADGGARGGRRSIPARRSSCSPSAPRSCSRRSRSRRAGSAWSRRG